MRRRNVIALTAGLLAALVAVAGLAYANRDDHTSAPSLSISPNSSSDTITEANGLLMWDPMHFAEGGYPAEDEKVAFLIQGLKDLEMLRAWHLCGTELKAAAAAENGLVKARNDYPLDQPNNEPLDDYGKKWLAGHAALGDALTAAVPLAEKSNLPCTPVVDNKLHNAQMSVTSGDKPRTLIVSDYDVMTFVRPLESYVAGNICASARKQRRDRLAEKPIDPSVNPSGETFGEAMKAADLAQYDAEIAMLKTDPRTDC